MKKILVRGFNCLSSIIPFRNAGISTLLKILSRLPGITGPVPPPLLMIFIFFLSYLVVYHSILNLSRIIFSAPGTWKLFLSTRYPRLVTLNYFYIFAHLYPRTTFFTFNTCKIQSCFRKFI